MTLGEFRKATEHLPDDCELERTDSDSNMSYTYDVDSVYVRTQGASEEVPKMNTTVVIV